MSEAIHFSGCVGFSEPFQVVDSDMVVVGSINYWLSSLMTEANILVFAHICSIVTWGNFYIKFYHNVYYIHY